MYTFSKSLSSLPRDELERLAQSGSINLGWWNSLGVDKPKAWSQYADGFYNAACGLMDRFLEKQGHSDANALPIFYMIFHFIELALKASIEAKLEWQRLLEIPIKEPPRNHNISNLLSYLASLFGPGDEFLSDETQEFIRKMAVLNGRSAQAFRYPSENKSGKNYWQDQPVFSIGILKVEFSIHGTELNGFQSMLCYPDHDSYDAESYDNTNE